MAQWGHADIRSKIKREVDFFIEVLRRSHERKRGWYKRAAVQQDVENYYGILREVLRGQGYGSKYGLKQCHGCGILFLTAVANRSRKKIWCVLGCRAMRKREKSNQRTKDYYSTEEGKKKKRDLNGQRGQPHKLRPQPKTPPLIQYYQWLTWNIDHEKLSSEEMEARLSKIRERVRQHRLHKDHKGDKVPP